MIVASFVLLMLALGLGFLRFLRGPQLWDRLLCGELIGTILVPVIVLTSHTLGEDFLMDVAIALTLLTFIGTAVTASLVDEESSE